MRLQYFLLIILASVSNCYAQDLLSVDWQNVVCQNGYIDQVYSTCNDNEGNTYMLGSFANASNCLGENVYENTGQYILTKQNSNGEKLFAKNLGGTNSYAFGDIEVCNNGDLVLGLCYKSNFFLNGDSITTSAISSTIVLKLDQELNIKWFKSFPAKNNVYINRLLVDNDDNIYASILFIDSLAINGEIYSQPKGYGTAIAKLNSDGNMLWSHHYYTDYHLLNRVLEIGTPCHSCPSTLYIAGSISGDSMLVDGDLKVQFNSKFNDQFFVATLNEHGDILQTKLLDDGIRSIADIKIYQNRIFFAGSYSDTVHLNGWSMTPVDNSSTYLAELSTQADLIGFADLQSSPSLYLTSFNISPQYGFLLSGIFDGSFSLLSSSVSLASQYNRGSVIASINNDFKLNDCKYIQGGSYNLRFLSVLNNKITGAAIFEQTCNFKNQSCFALNDDISTFQTSDIKQLSSFIPQQFPIHEIPIPFSVQVYPNPFTTSFQLKFSEPIYSTSLTIKNAVGQICKDILISQINDSEVNIEADGLATGLYFVEYLTCNNAKGISKLIKVN